MVLTPQSNILELMAAAHVLKAFSNLLDRACVKFLMDNRTAVAYIANQGGTRSLPTLNSWPVTPAGLPSGQGEHPSRKAKSGVSGQERVALESQISQISFQQLEYSTSGPDGDCREHPPSSLLLPILQAMAQEAFSISWNLGLLYMLSPTALILRTDLRPIFVAPFWPRGL